MAISNTVSKFWKIWMFLNNIFNILNIIKFNTTPDSIVYSLIFVAWIWKKKKGTGAKKPNQNNPKLPVPHSPSSKKTKTKPPPMWLAQAVSDGALATQWVVICCSLAQGRWNSQLCICWLSPHNTSQYQSLRR